ncbi:MAG TPA: carbohydrate ABC transporter permease, partial [Deinococcales bacterium]|nr:carbohydrate ABC transporter permease [Deinococcales bacterium]
SGTDHPTAERLPLDVSSPDGFVFQSAPLDPTFREQVMLPTADRPYAYPRSQTFDNITPGVINYVFRNYVRIFEQTRSYTTGQSLFGLWILNSALLVLLVVASTVVIASIGGYALARFEFPGKNFLFIFILFTMTLPGQVTFISNYLVLRDGVWGLSHLWGQQTLLNSVIGLWAVMFVNAGAVFLMKQFFESLPRELEEAAKIDGAGPLQTFVRVILPNAGPALIALVITTAQGAWNQYFWAAVVLQTPDDRFTLPIGINQFQRAYGATGDYGLLLAGAVFSAIPVIILFIVFQRYFVEGVSFSGGKE